MKKVILSSIAGLFVLTTTHAMAMDKDMDMKKDGMMKHEMKKDDMKKDDMMKHDMKKEEMKK